MPRPKYELISGATAIDGSARSPVRLRSLVFSARVGGAAPTVRAVFESADLPFAPTDPLSVRLGTAESGMTDVFEGRIDSVSPMLTETLVVAVSPAVDLLDLVVDESFEKQTAGAIARDLAGRAGISAGSVEDGIEFPYYVIDDRRNACEHLRRLAMGCGFDLYFDAANALAFAPYQPAQADHAFEYGVDLIDARVRAQPPPYDRVDVIPESPASSEGEEAASWIAAAPSDFAGSAGSGDRALVVRDRAIRTQEGAQQSADGRLAVLQRHAVEGQLVALGRASVSLGQRIEVVGVDGISGTYQVASVTHKLTHAEGFLTTMSLWGGE